MAVLGKVPTVLKGWSKQSNKTLSLLLKGIGMAEKKDNTLQVGYAVALTAKEGVAPFRCYVGQIEAIDQRGVRLTLMDWFAGAFTGNDLFVPWSNIDSCLVCTENHDLGLFLKRGAPKFQEQMNGDKWAEEDEQENDQ